jgi:hypothetical protein
MAAENQQLQAFSKNIFGPWLILKQEKKLSLQSIILFLLGV